MLKVPKDPRNGTQASPGQRNSTASQKPSIPPKLDFLFHAKYTNSLPDLPYPGKYLKCNKRTLKERFADYHPTQLEINHKRINICDIDAGSSIDLVDPEAYREDRENPPEMDPKDVRLLEDESKEFLLKTKRSQQHATAVPFMRRTEYIAAEFNRFGTGADRQEIKVGYNLLKRGQAEEIFYRDRESQIDAINKTFEDVKKPVTKHHSKPDVTAVEECPIFPDFDLWKFQFAQVLFDADPTCPGIPDSLQKTCLEHSRIMICGESEEYVGLFCPPIETLQQIMEDEEEEVEGKDYVENTYNYNLNREYAWKIRAKSHNSFEDDFFFHRQGDNFYYNELSNNVKLERKRITRGVEDKKKNIILEMSCRAPDEHDLADIQKKMQQLMHPEREEEDEEQADEGENENKEENGETEAQEGEAADSDGDSSSTESSSTSSSSPTSDTD